MKSLISEGKTSNEAIENGLRELGLKREDVSIRVIESEDKRSFFSILDPRSVKVELTVKENANNYQAHKDIQERDLSDEDFEIAKKDLNVFLEKFVVNFNGMTYVIERDSNMINISISGDDSGKLIGYRGDVINALQVVVSAVANKHTTDRVRVSLDICNYKSKRESTLRELARKLERSVTRTGKKIILEPMSAYERKVLHTELQNSRTVTTYSIGEEPRRKLVVERK